MRIDRLEQAIATLERVDAENLPFTLLLFHLPKDQARAQAEAYGDAIYNINHPCDTVCCAAGWIGMDPVHQEQGFTIFENNVTFADKHVIHYNRVGISSYFENKDIARYFYPNKGVYKSENPTLPTVIKELKKFLAKQKALQPQI